MGRVYILSWVAMTLACTGTVGDACSGSELGYGSPSITLDLGLEGAERCTIHVEPDYTQCGVEHHGGVFLLAGGSRVTACDDPAVAEGYIHRATLIGQPSSTREVGLCSALATLTLMTYIDKVPGTTYYDTVFALSGRESGVPKNVAPLVCELAEFCRAPRQCPRF